MPLEKYEMKVSAYVSAEVHAATKAMADHRGVTVSQLIGTLVTRELAREARKARKARKAVS